MFQPPKIAELKQSCQFRLWGDFPSSNSLLSDYDAGILRWCKIVAAKGSAFYETAQTDKAVTHKVITREIANVSNNHVMEHAGNRYRIHRVMNIAEKPEWYVVDVELLGVITGV